MAWAGSNTLHVYGTMITFSLHRNNQRILKNDESSFKANKNIITIELENEHQHQWPVSSEKWEKKTKRLCPKPKPLHMGHKDKIRDMLCMGFGSQYAALRRIEFEKCQGHTGNVTTLEKNPQW